MFELMLFWHAVFAAWFAPLPGVLYMKSRVARVGNKIFLGKIKEK